MATPLRLVLLGPPGVGKGTQAEKLERSYRAKQLSTGMIFRSEMAAQTDLGLLAKSYMEKGDLVPDEVTVDMVAKKLQSEDIRKSGFILDGFPRNVAQAEALAKMLADMGESLQRVICLLVDENIVVARLSGRLVCGKCGEIFHLSSRPPKVEGICDKCSGELVVRPDDDPDVVRERLRVFKKATAPVSDYYERVGLLSVVDGSGAPDEVFAQIRAALDSNGAATATP